MSSGPFTNATSEVMQEFMRGALDDVLGPEWTSEDVARVTTVQVDALARAAADRWVRAGGEITPYDLKELKRSATVMVAMRRRMNRLRVLVERLDRSVEGYVDDPEGRELTEDEVRSRYDALTDSLAVYDELDANGTLDELDAREDFDAKLWRQQRVKLGVQLANFAAARQAAAREERIAQHRQERAAEPVVMGRACSNCGKPAKFDDLCGRCADAAGTRPHGKIGES